VEEELPPDASANFPPAPLSPDPTVILTLPLVPEDEDPVRKTIAPLLPLEDVPVFNESIPLTPLASESDDTSVNEPLLVELP
jgi:hypothetical protein